MGWRETRGVKLKLDIKTSLETDKSVVEPTRHRREPRLPSKFAAHVSRARLAASHLQGKSSARISDAIWQLDQVGRIAHIHGPRLSNEAGILVRQRGDFYRAIGLMSPWEFQMNNLALWRHNDTTIVCQRGLTVMLLRRVPHSNFYFFFSCFLRFFLFFPPFSPLCLSFLPSLLPFHLNKQPPPVLSTSFCSSTIPIRFDQPEFDANIPYDINFDRLNSYR